MAYEYYGRLVDDSGNVVSAGCKFYATEDNAKDDLNAVTMTASGGGTVVGTTVTTDAGGWFNVTHASYPFLWVRAVGSSKYMGITAVNALDISQLSAEATVDGTSDYVLMYDASATSLKKVLVDNIVAEAPTDASVESITNGVRVHVGTWHLTVCSDAAGSYTGIADNDVWIQRPA